MNKASTLHPGYVGLSTRSSLILALVNLTGGSFIDYVNSDISEQTLAVMVASASRTIALDSFGC